MWTFSTFFNFTFSRVEGGRKTTKRKKERTGESS